MSKLFPYRCTSATIALKLDGYYVWDSSVIKANGEYYMFSSRWPEKYGFGVSWLYHSEIILSKSSTPEGPYSFVKVILPRRGHDYFDGMNTHNTCIRAFKDKYYLYYMGVNYEYDPPEPNAPCDPVEWTRIWNKKRIGMGISDSIDGNYVRRDKPILEPRKGGDFWDGTITTNPAVAILPNGKTYMIYKSRKNDVDITLKLGVAVSDKPDGVFTRLSNDPILQFEDTDMHVEDPFLWFDEKRNKFCLIAKDDVKNGKKGLTSMWGNGFYAESDDCIHFDIEENPEVYSRNIVWKDGHTSLQGNLERPSVLFDENGVPTHMFFASGDADSPYAFKGTTYVICMKLERIN